MQSRFIMDMTWKEYRSKIDDHFLILPVGATEQHSLHLPLGVDTMLSTSLSHALAEQTNAVIAPPLSYGYKSQPASGGGPMFPGTIDLNGATLTALVYDLLAEYFDDGWQNILIYSGHFENDAFLAEAADLLLRKQSGAFPKVLLSNWWDNISETLMPKVFDEVAFAGWGLEHAAIVETSMMIYFHPELVYEEKITDEGISHPPSYQRFPPDKSQIPESGSLHTARSSSALKGQWLVGNVTENILSFCSREFPLSTMHDFS